VGGLCYLFEYFARKKIITGRDGDRLIALLGRRMDVNE
jgi:hypothetical protein